MEITILNIFCFARIGSRLINHQIYLNDRITLYYKQHVLRSREKYQIMNSNFEFIFNNFIQNFSSLEDLCNLKMAPTTLPLIFCFH